MVYPMKNKDCCLLNGNDEISLLVTVKYVKQKNRFFVIEDLEFSNSITWNSQ